MNHLMQYLYILVLSVKDSKTKDLADAETANKRNTVRSKMKESQNCYNVTGILCRPL